MHLLCVTLQPAADEFCRVAVGPGSSAAAYEVADSNNMPTLTLLGHNRCVGGYHGTSDPMAYGHKRCRCFQEEANTQGKEHTYVGERRWRA